MLGGGLAIGLAGLGGDIDGLDDPPPPNREAGVGGAGLIAIGTGAEGGGRAGCNPGGAVGPKPSPATSWRLGKELEPGTERYKCGALADPTITLPFLGGFWGGGVGGICPGGAGADASKIRVFDMIKEPPSIQHNQYLFSSQPVGVSLKK